MTAQQPILNPRNSDFDYKLYKASPDRINNRLCKENCYNPLIAGTLKKNALSSINDHRLIEIMDFNANWCCDLQLIREGIEQNQMGWVLKGLESTYESFQRIDQPFIDFLELKNIFERCQWLWRPTADPQVTLFNDVLYRPLRHNEEPPEGWTRYVTYYECPKDKLKEYFGTRADMDTEHLGAYGFKNPYAQILQCRIEEDTFSNAQELWRDEYLSKIKPDNVQEEHESGNTPEPLPQPLTFKGYHVTIRGERIQYSEEKPYPGDSDTILKSKIPSPGLDGLLEKTSKINVSRRTFERKAAKHYKLTNNKIVYTDTKTGYVWIDVADIPILAAISKPGRHTQQ